MAFSIAPLLLSLAVSAAASDFDTAYERGFRDSYRSNAVEACMAAVTHPVPAGIDLRAVCACTTDRVMGSKSSSELAATSDPETDAAAAACLGAAAGQRRRR